MLNIVLTDDLNVSGAVRAASEQVPVELMRGDDPGRAHAQQALDDFDAGNRPHPGPSDGGVGRDGPAQDPAVAGGEMGREFEGLDPVHGRQS
jgi:hypothetical protein